MNAISKKPVPAKFQDIAAICEATEVVIGGKTVLGVNARKLHTGLKVGRVFAAWITERIEKCGFQEGVDFEIFDFPKPENQKGRGGDRRSKGYRITLRVAKHLAMVENNDLGKQVRDYFIWCEGSAFGVGDGAEYGDHRQQDFFPDPTPPAQPDRSGFTYDQRKVMGGIAKAVNTPIVKQEVRQAVEPIVAEVSVLHAKIDKLTALTERKSPAFAVPSQAQSGNGRPKYQSMRAVLHERGFRTEGLRYLSGPCSSKFRQWCLRNDYQRAVKVEIVQRCCVFRSDAVAKWIDSEGEKFLRERTALIGRLHQIPIADLVALRQA